MLLASSTISFAGALPIIGNALLDCTGKTSPELAISSEVGGGASSGTNMAADECGGEWLFFRAHSR